MKIKVLSNINSGQFVAGDVIDLPDDEANALIEAGAAEATEHVVTEAAEQQPPLEPTPPASESEPEPQSPKQPVLPEPTVQPTASQIAEDLKIAESGSKDSKEIHIS